MLSPRALVRGNPARAKFAAENELTHNNPKHFQTCHKIVPYETVDI